jgi:hypothetical protein
MSITINWPATNVGVATAVRIYVDTSKIPDDTLPAPIVTLAGTETSFIWASPPTDNTVYYFRIAIDREADTWLSDNQQYGYFVSTGPGPQQVVRGDWEYGYFGFVPKATMVTMAQLSVILATDAMTPAPEVNFTGFHKLAWQGKIYFYPDAYVASNQTWQTYYGKGYMYGIDGNGNPPISVTPTNQLKIVTIGSNQFKVRSFKTHQASTDVAVSSIPNDGTSEWDKLVCRLHLVTALPGNAIHLSDVAYDPYRNSVGQHIWNISLGHALQRGRSDIEGSTNVIFGAGYGWIPLLELQF